MWQISQITWLGTLLCYNVTSALALFSCMSTQFLYAMKQNNMQIKCVKKRAVTSAKFIVSANRLVWAAASPYTVLCKPSNVMLKTWFVQWIGITYIKASIDNSPNISVDHQHYMTKMSRSQTLRVKKVRSFAYIPDTHIQWRGIKMLYLEVGLYISNKCFYYLSSRCRDTRGWANSEDFAHWKIWCWKECSREHHLKKKSFSV